MLLKGEDLGDLEHGHGGALVDQGFGVLVERLGGEVLTE